MEWLLQYFIFVYRPITSKAPFPCIVLISPTEQGGSYATGCVDAIKYILLF